MRIITRKGFLGGITAAAALCAVVPLSLTLKNCRLSFAEVQNEFIRGANLSIDFSDVEVEGVDGCVLRNYGQEVEIKAKDLKGVKPSARKADEQFSVKAI